MCPTETQRLIVDVPLVFDFAKRDSKKLKPDELIILLHGFNESGSSFLEKLDPLFSQSDVFIIAPNGPFPMPHKTDQGYRMGFSWYFYDSNTDEYFIDMATAIESVCKAIEKLNLVNTPKRIIGFSQGGYLAPFLGLKLSAVKNVIGIGCEYLVDEWPAPISFKLDGIHGAQDEVVPLSLAQGSFKRITLASLSQVPGTFSILPNSSHRIDKAILDKLKELL